MQSFKRLFITALIGLTGLGSVQAEINRIDYNFNAVSIPAAVQKVTTSSIYIVQMEGAPVVSYEGDVAGYKATKPGKGQKVNPKSAHVKKYAAYLETQQDDTIDSVSANKVYSYRYAFNGFAARMTEADAATLKRKSDVVNVWKDEIRQLQTDGSPNYIGITEGGEAWSKGRTGEDVIIGVIDTGVWPEHPSFADVKTYKKGNKGPKIAYGPIPDGFTPSGCDFGNTAANPLDGAFFCNNKLLSATCYNLGFSSAPDAGNPCGGDGAFTASYEFQSGRDVNGHGSHTASTAGGNNGVAAVVGGEFQGLVSGIAPRARVATYKVCWDDLTNTGDGGCASSDSAAAIDQAVFDGADVINFSIGGSSNSFSGPDDIAFLFAADAGVFVATSNGNAGPGAGTVGTPSGVPWITAVGATQDDGVYYADVTVNSPGSIAGTYTAVEGASPATLMDTGPITDDMTHSIPADGCGDTVGDGSGDPIGFDNTIDGIALVVRGGCTFSLKYNNASLSGASAIIVYTDDRPITTMSAPGTTIPGVMVSNADGLTMAGETGVNATLSLVSAANRIAGFSSRGPNNGALDIIKPDVSAPGVAILAAGPGDNYFMSINGTSMASPHVAGAFALLKQTHPYWSAAQARSALMTTGRQGLKKTFGDEPADPFDIGAGEILPSAAYDPGLAYDVGFYDYLAMLCGEPAQAGLVSAGTCGYLEFVLGLSLDPSDLNLASIGIGGLVGSQTITRNVTAVYNNEGNKTFTVSVDAPAGIDVSVSPSTFTLAKGDSMSYEVTFSVTGAATMEEWAFGSLTWTDDDDNYAVRSPIAIQPLAATAANVFTKNVDTSTAASGDTLTYELSVTNDVMTGPVTVTDVLPVGTTFVAASETETVTDGSTSSAWAYDGGSNSLSWTGELDLGEISVSPSPAPFGYFSLGAFGVIPFDLPGNCDDGAWSLNVPTFTYNGASYSSVIWSVNGTIEAGTASGLATSFANQDLPDATPPNNVLAPFWRDLNLCNGGNWYVASLSAGSSAWTIYEWENTPHFGSADAVTMQVWIGINGTAAAGNIHYVYERLDNTGAGTTVGAENASGTIGDSYFFSGLGTAPAVGVDLLVETLSSGNVTLGFQVTTDCSEDSIVNTGDLSNGDKAESAIAVTSCP